MELFFFERNNVVLDFPLFKKFPIDLSAKKLSIYWNFTKFLVTDQGKVIKRYAPTVKPEAIEKDIVKLLTE